MRSNCCRCSFEKQPEGRSRRSAKGAGVARRARAERKSKGETLVFERQDGPQFPLRPYTWRPEPITRSSRRALRRRAAVRRRAALRRTCVDP